MVAFAVSRVIALSFFYVYSPAAHTWPVGSFRVPRPLSVRSQVSDIESTPNQHSFIIRFDVPPKIDGVGGLKGRTFRLGEPAPAALDSVLRVEGVDSVYAMEKMLTVNKRPSAEWRKLLPQVLFALGGATETLAGSSKLRGIMDPDLSPTNELAGCVKVRLQISLGLPIQVEAVGSASLAPAQRAKLSPRFKRAMMLLADTSGDDFFTSREWRNRGLRYVEDDADPAGDNVSNLETAADRERRTVATVLAAELAEIEEAYSDDRLAAIVAAAKTKAAAEDHTGDKPQTGSALTLADVEALCDEDAANEAASTPNAPSSALKALAKLAGSGEGKLAARRTAIAYLGGTTGRGGDVVFSAIATAFERERAAGMRRTAGDALCDLGDLRAVPLAVEALTDRSKLVRWRAARILGELTTPDDKSTLAALEQAETTEVAFEVAFEMADAIRRIKARLDPSSEGSANVGPMWRQIQDGVVDSSPLVLYM